MIDIAWLNDERSDDPEEYLIDWNDKKSRMRAFLAGWGQFLTGDYSYSQISELTWHAVGAYYASVLGDIEVAKRRWIYYAALAEYIKSDRCFHWTDEQRQKALRRARQGAQP